MNLIMRLLEVLVPKKEVLNRITDVPDSVRKLGMQGKHQ